MEADGKISASASWSGKTCDCCGKSKTVKSEKTYTISGTGEVGFTLGKRINQNVLGINFMGFFGVRFATTGGVTGSGTFKGYCDGTSTDEFDLAITAGGSIEGGAMFEYAYPKGYPWRLTGPPWGTRHGIGVTVYGDANVTTGIHGECQDGKCEVYLREQWDASYGIKAQLGILSFSTKLGEADGTWSSSKPFMEICDPFTN